MSIRTHLQRRGPSCGKHVRQQTLHGGDSVAIGDLESEDLLAALARSLRGRGNVAAKIAPAPGCCAALAFWNAVFGTTAQLERAD
jgi:hypothetical protein